ncbi:methyltransferase domain-containing protein, partial [Candidatus Binatia bacterium]|nr:methyltransferase domain-containing protein [Candidatus Binatia bacterium]
SPPPRDAENTPSSPPPHDAHAPHRPDAAHAPHAHDAAHGSHDATARHAFDDVAHWSRIFDDPARDAWQKPAELVQALALTPGATVADLGAGTGYLSRYLARAVGPSGTVLAADTEPALVEHLRQRAERDGLANLVPILASTDNPRLPAGTCDVILIVDTWHHIDDRVAYARRLAAALAPGGRVVVVDWQKGDLPVGPPPEHKLAREQVIDELTRAGYRLREEPGLLPYQYVLVFAR